MSRIEISTVLNAPPERIAAEVRTSKLLKYVARGMLAFRPIDPPAFPDVWTEGHYKAAMLWKGFLPIGWQIIGIEILDEGPKVWRIRDNGRGALIKTWDHVIELRADGDGTHYTDRLDLDAGLLTPFVHVFASLFYRHRQKRWRRLVANGFDYSR